MKYWLVPFTTEWEGAAQRCNDRLRSSGQAPFYLPVRSQGTAPGEPVRQEYWLAVSDSEVHGGCLLQFQPAWVDGEITEAVNIQSPLSEGLADRQHAGLAVWMLKEIQGKFPLAYSVGMGSEQSPYARLLKALRWRVESVPFFFRAFSGRRLLANLGPLRRHRLRSLARAGSLVPALPDWGVAAIHYFNSKPAPPTPPLADPQWNRIRFRYAFAMDRSEEMIASLYADAGRFQRVRVSGAFAILAHMSCREHPYFGNLRVTTLVDAIFESGAERAIVDAASTAARQHGADLMVTNQSAAEMIEALKQAGWLGYASNYVVAFSPALAARIKTAPYLITRGDGDGLLNL